MDVRVMPGPGVSRGIVVPAHELVEQFSHSGGPGGQGVNTSDSRVQLSWDIAASGALSPAQRERLLARLETRLNGSVITVSSSEQRSQLRNRAAARERLAGMIRDALVPHVTRRATKPTLGSKRRRVENKLRRSETKRNRQRPGAD